MNCYPNLNPNPDVPNILVPKPFNDANVIELPFKPVTTFMLKHAVYLFRNKDENVMAKNVQRFGKMDTWIVNSNGIVDMSGLFAEFEFDNVNDIITDWATPYVKNMSYMFYNCTNFNQSLALWDVRNVTNMSYMFYNCTNFNQDLSAWHLYSDYDESPIENMSFMFYNCVNFNQDLGDWTVGNVKNMTHMFYNCAKFNKPLNEWNVENVFNMRSMFYNCSSFNQNINDWSVVNVANMSNMFYNCFEFNEPLDKWNIANVVNMTNMFYNCVKFNQSLIDWDVSTTCDITGMFLLSNLTTNKYPPKIKNKLIAQLPIIEKRRLELLLQPQQTNPTIFKNAMLNKVTATPIVLSNDPIASLTSQTTMYNSIELENINVVKYLKENANNLVFYYNNAFYPINKTNLFAFTSDGNKVKFKCNQVYTIINITPDKYDAVNPYLLGSSFSCHCGLLLLSQIKTILNSPDQLFEIIPTGTSAPSTVSYQMTTPRANAIGASHCQEGQGANINNIVKHTIPDFPENLQEAVDVVPVVPEIENTIGVNYKDITYKFGITPETTVGEFKQMVLDKLVLENQIDNVNKKVRFLYSGKIIQEDSLLLLQIPNVAFGVTFNVLISPNVAGGKLTRRIKRRGKRRVTKKISRRKKTRRLKKIRHKKTKTRR